MLRATRRATAFGASTGACTTGVECLQPARHTTRSVSQDCREAIAADVSNKSQTRQTMVEANLQGGLFDLPAGQLRFARGRQLSRDSITSSPPRRSRPRPFVQSTRSIGIYPSSQHPDAGIDVKELYGELLIPVLSRHPVHPGLQSWKSAAACRTTAPPAPATPSRCSVDWADDRLAAVPRRVQPGGTGAEHGRAATLAAADLPQRHRRRPLLDASTSAPRSANPGTNADGAARRAERARRSAWS